MEFGWCVHHFERYESIAVFILAINIWWIPTGVDVFCMRAFVICLTVHRFAETRDKWIKMWKRINRERKVVPQESSNGLDTPTWALFLYSMQLFLYSRYFSIKREQFLLQFTCAVYIEWENISNNIYALGEELSFSTIEKECDCSFPVCDPSNLYAE